MKKYFVAFGCFFALFSCNTTDQSKKFASAAEYDDFIISRITQMQQSLFAVQNGKSDSAQIDGAIKKYENQIDSINKTIKNLPDYNGNKAYRNAAANLGVFYKKSIGTYFADIAKIYQNVKDTTADTKVQELIARLQDEEAKADDEFIKEREAFAEKNKLNLDNKE